jgi:hypothetical protein
MVLLPSPRRRGVGGEVRTILVELTLNPVDLSYGEVNLDYFFLLPISYPEGSLLNFTH